MEEVWKDIVGYEGLYRVSDRGNVLSLNYRNNGYSRQLVPKRNSKGRLWVLLYRDGKKKPFLIHRLVAVTFIPNPERLPEINHKDENPLNNSVGNLEWCTRKYNVRYYFNKRSAYKENITRQGKRKKLEIIQETVSGQCVRRWANSRQIKTELGWSDWSISECCRGNRKTAYGFVWRYAS